MIRFCRDVIEAARADHRARRALVWECVALQHQLAVLSRSGTRRPRFRPIDRLFWVFMSWWWPAWRDGLKVIQPETVLRWRRLGIALIWKYRSRGRWRGGRPRIALETRQPFLKFGLDCAPSPITFHVLSLHRLAVFARLARRSARPKQEAAMP